MDIKEIREVLDKLEGGALKHCDNDEDYHKFILADREFRKKSLDYCRFLLSEVEGLQNTIAQMQDVEQTVYECRMKGGDAVRHLLDSLLAENKQLKDSLYKNSRVGDYTLLEERCAKLEKENAALREELKLSHDVVEAAKEAIVCVGFADLMATCPSVRKEFEPIRDRLLEALKKIKEE